MAGAMRRVLSALAVITGVAIALTGGVAAWATWAVMATYADDVPNTLLQNLSPLLLIFPAFGSGAVLVWIGLRLWRRPDLD